MMSAKRSSSARSAADGTVTVTPCTRWTTVRLLPHESGCTHHGKPFRRKHTLPSEIAGTLGAEHLALATAEEIRQTSAAHRQVTRHAVCLECGRGLSQMAGRDVVFAAQ